MDDRELILGRLPEPLGEQCPTSRIPVRAVPTDDHWSRFVERVEALGGEVRAIEDLSGLSGYCDADVPSFVENSLGEVIQNVWEAEAGVTRCELAVAETGSLLIAAGEGRARLASLAPPIHVALVDKSHLVASLEEAFDRLPQETCFLVSGPSRTADIEGVMVMGVHGPKRLWVVPLP